MRSAVQIDVVTPAASYNLIDLTTLKTLLNQADGSLDSYLTEIIPQASGNVADYCNNPLRYRRSLRIAGAGGCL